MLEKTEYVYFLKDFYKKLGRIIYKIENNKDEISDNDREIIAVTVQAFIKKEKEL